MGVCEISRTFLQEFLFVVFSPFDAAPQVFDDTSLNADEKIAKYEEWLESNQRSIDAPEYNPEDDPSLRRYEWLAKGGKGLSFRPLQAKIVQNLVEQHHGDDFQPDHRMEQATRATGVGSVHLR